MAKAAWSVATFDFVAPEVGSMIDLERVHGGRIIAMVERINEVTCVMVNDVSVKSVELCDQ